jgi:hypothetical protein
VGSDTLLGPEETDQAGIVAVGWRSCAVLIVSRKDGGRRFSSFAGSLSCHIGLCLSFMEGCGCLVVGWMWLLFVV